MNVKRFELRSAPSGNARLYIEVDAPAEKLSEIYADIQNGKQYKVDITPVTKKRSLNQNALLWHYVGLISQELYISKEDAYHEILRKYGVFTPMRIVKEAISELEGVFGYIEVVEEYADGNVLILAYKGMSTMSTEEASRVIDGAKSDAEEMGIYENDFGN